MSRIGGNVTSLGDSSHGDNHPLAPCFCPTEPFADMDRKIEEGEYVVNNLYRTKEQVIAHPEWFEPDALERIDEAIACLQEKRIRAAA